MSDIILFNKPFNVLSQFTDDGGRETLANYLKAPRFRAAGRLDYDSEGLLLLTDDGQLQQKIANPRHKQWKTYLVQVEGEITQEALDRLHAGITMKDGATLPARAQQIAPPELWPRVPPVRFRKSVPDCWIQLAIQEGRNRQVRRMTAHVGFPTLRLVRTDIGDWSIAGLKPGEHRTVAVNDGSANVKHKSTRGKR